MDEVVMGDEPKSPKQEAHEAIDVLDNVAAKEESHDGDTKPDNDTNSDELPSEQEAAPALTSVRRQMSQSVDVQKNKNVNKDLGKAKSNHVLAASEQPLSSQVSALAHHSLAEERQALKLRERQKKTTDAVNEMRRRLEAMGIMPRDKGKDAETVSGDNKSTSTGKENANTTEKDVTTLPSSQTTQTRVKPTGWSNSNPQSNSTSSDDNSKAEEQCPAPILPSSSGSSKAVDTSLQLSAPEHSPLSPSRASGIGRKQPSLEDPVPLEGAQGGEPCMPPSYAEAMNSSRTTSATKEGDAVGQKGKAFTDGDDDSSGRFIDANATVLQSLSRPVSDYRKSLQDLQAAMDRVLNMYEEANVAHSRLSQSFASFPPPSVASSTAAEELNAVSGVLSDLRTGIVQANQRLSTVLPPSSAIVGTPSQKDDEDAMRRKYAELAELVEKE
eukprot:g2657.t1